MKIGLSEAVDKYRRGEVAELEKRIAALKHLLAVRDIQLNASMKLTDVLHQPGIKERISPMVLIGTVLPVACMGQVISEEASKLVAALHEEDRVTQEDRKAALTDEIKEKARDLLKKDMMGRVYGAEPGPAGTMEI